MVTGMDFNLQEQMRRQQQRTMQQEVQAAALRTMFGERGYLEREVRRDKLVYKNCKRKERENTRLENKELKKRKEKFLEDRKSKQGKALNETEWRELDDLLREETIIDGWMKEKHGKFTNEQILRQLNNGDNSNFEKLDGTFRDLLAAKFIHRYPVFRYVNDERQMNQEEINELVDRVQADGMFYNPLFRLGISQMARETEDRGATSNFRKIDNEIARRIMVKTLTHTMTHDEETRYEENIQRNAPELSEQSVKDMRRFNQRLEKAKRAQMAKQLLLMHMGKLKIVNERPDGSKVGEEPNVPMASILAHCSRTMIVTPNFTGDESGEEEMWNSILRHYNTNGHVYTNAAQIRRRGSSTHSLVRRKEGEQFGVEKKKWFNFVRQTGMDVAIGGLGASGVDGRMLDQDGSCGHVYGMRKKSKKGTNGGYIFGYESDSYGHTNQLGHTHDLKATGEKASSFLCHRADEVGMKLAGRQADISRIQKGLIIRTMNSVDKAFDSFDDEQLIRISEKLTGNIMNDDEFLNFLINDLGMNHIDATRLYEQRQRIG